MKHLTIHEFVDSEEVVNIFFLPECIRDQVSADKIGMEMFDAVQ